MQVINDSSRTLVLLGFTCRLDGDRTSFEGWRVSYSSNGDRFHAEHEILNEVVFTFFDVLIERNTNHGLKWVRSLDSPSFCIFDVVHALVKLSKEN